MEEMEVASRDIWMFNVTKLSTNPPLQAQHSLFWFVKAPGICVNIFILNLIPDFILSHHAASRNKKLWCDFDCLLLHSRTITFLCENRIKRMFVIHWIGCMWRRTSRKTLRGWRDLHFREDFKTQNSWLAIKNALKMDLK